MCVKVSGQGGTHLGRFRLNFNILKIKKNYLKSSKKKKGYLINRFKMISDFLQTQFVLEDNRLMSSKSWQKILFLSQSINQPSEQNKILLY